MAWPEGFWWGTASSSTQAEGAAPRSDWSSWEASGRAPQSGDGNGFGTRYAEDFALLAQHGLPHHRLSIEWARLEPEEGKHDTQALAHYKAMLESAKAAGLSVWVTLHHFTLPGWFADDLKGFRDDRSGRYRWSRHVDFVGETFGDLVTGWKPINEPVAYAAAAFLTGVHPPGRQDADDFRTVVRTMHRANADAARLLRGTGAPISTIHNLAPLRPVDGSAEASRATSVVDDMIWKSWSEPELLEPFDLLGFSYYNAFAVAPDATFRPYPADGRVGPMGYVPWSEGLGEVLHRLADEHPDRPLLVCEHGVGTDDDRWRADVLRDSLNEVDEAIGDGCDVRGFFHWTAVDNYEWGHGYDVQFGLFDRDRNPRASLEVVESAARSVRGA